MMSDFREEMAFFMSTIGVTLIALFILVFSAMVFFNYVGKGNCVKSSVSFAGYEYSFLGGCMVKNGEDWVPIGNVIIEKVN